MRENQKIWDKVEKFLGSRTDIKAATPAGSPAVPTASSSSCACSACCGE